MIASDLLGGRLAARGRLTFLFFQARRTGWAIVSIAAIAAFVAGLRFVMREADSQGLDPLTNGSDGSPVAFVLLFVPLAMALVVGVATHGPFGELERTVSRPLPPLRLVHLAGLLGCGVVALALLALTWEGDSARLFLRNLAGFAGLAFLAAPLTGGRLSWVLPFTYGIIAFWAGMGSKPPSWAWPMQPWASMLSLAIAVTLLGAGVAIIVLSGGRDVQGEAD